MGKGAEGGPEGDRREGDSDVGSGEEGERKLRRLKEGREGGGKGGEEWKLLGTVALSGVLFNRDCPIKHPILAYRKRGVERGASERLGARGIL